LSIIEGLDSDGVYNHLNSTQPSYFREPSVPILRELSNFFHVDGFGQHLAIDIVIPFLLKQRFMWLP